MERGFSRLLFGGIVGIALIGGGGMLCGQTERLGDGNDGSRTPYVHVIDLLDENGVKIRAADKKQAPFSTRKTCGECHTYEAIEQGWHFCSPDPNTPPGRPGEPWVLADAKTRTQIPISTHGWKGTFHPEQVGLSAWTFLAEFGSHIPGGGYGEMEADPEKAPQEMIRRQISGSYEINCLTCHNRDPRQDSNTAALQAARQNYRWIATASSGLAVVNGTASALSDFFDPEFDKGITVTYNEGVFNKDDQAVLDIVRDPPPDRCYFCHSSQNLAVSGTNEWTRDEDVHLKAGLTCTDCHRNGRDHKIARGFEMTEPGKAGLTCEGCHLGTGPAGVPDAGRMGAPRPKHAGIPTIHFEKLTCTACHSSTWPEEQAGQWRTSRIHKLGLHGKHALDLRLPHVYGPVMMKGEDGKIGPYRLFWPAYWGYLRDGQVTPLHPAAVLKFAGPLLETGQPKENDWLPLTEEQITGILKRLSSEDVEAVYIAGGKMYRRTEGGGLESEAHPAAEPYAWPIAHDVRPGQQSLGTKTCSDCHSGDSPFFFGTVAVDTPAAGGEELVSMTKLEGIPRFRIWAFNVSFLFRPWMKAVSLAAGGLIGLVLLAYALKAVAVISRKAGEDRR